MSYCERTSLSDTQLLLLMEELRPSWEALDLHLQTRHLPFEDRVVITLRYKKQGITQAELAEEYGVGQRTISGIVREVLSLVAGLGVLTRYGEVVTTLEEALAYLAQHGATGLLDGTLIPSVDTKQEGHFSGKHKSPGKNIQVISDLGGQPLWTSEPAPGGRNDSRAARECGIFEAADAAEVTLLADLGYSKKDALTPMRKPRHRELTEVEKECNREHSSIRSAVERAIRRIKTWRLLHRRSLPVHLLGTVLRSILVLESRKLWT